MEQQEQEMPYSGDFKVAYEIVEIVGKEQRIPVSELYPQVSAKYMSIKSHSKRIAEFLGLITSIGANIEITDLGRIFVAHRSEAERNKLLARSLPKKYFTMLRWIKNSNEGSMALTDLKTRIVENKMEIKNNNKTYDWILQMFGNFTESIGVISYIKGKSSRFQITELGLSVLDGSLKSELPNSPVNVQGDTPITIQKHQKISALEGDYPILIMTKDRKPMDIDIHDEVDWEIVDSYIKSLKIGWKKNFNKNQGKDKNEE